MVARQAPHYREDENSRDSGIVMPDAVYAAHVPAVERVIATMRERLGEALTLQDMAGMAHMSPYYFSRVFRTLIGIPPAEYLAALRIQEAKRLLLTTPESVTSICLEVGYTGLGTFTARFTRLVGVSPGRLRRQAGDVDSIVAATHVHGRIATWTDATSTGVSGVVQGCDSELGLIFVGLFPTPIPQSRPIGCALLDGPGSYHIPAVPDGRYYAMAAAFPDTARGLGYLLPDDGLRVGIACTTVTVRAGQADTRADITVRPLRPTDPPLLVALPFLLLDHPRALAV